MLIFTSKTHPHERNSGCFRFQSSAAGNSKEKQAKTEHKTRL